MKPGELEIEYLEGLIYLRFNGERVACLEPRRVPGIVIKLVSIIGNWHTSNKFVGPR